MAKIGCTSHLCFFRPISMGWSCFFWFFLDLILLLGAKNPKKRIFLLFWSKKGSNFFRPPSAADFFPFDLLLFFFVENFRFHPAFFWRFGRNIPVLGQPPTKKKQKNWHLRDFFPQKRRFPLKLPFFSLKMPIFPENAIFFTKKCHFFTENAIFSLKMPFFHWKCHFFHLEMPFIHLEIANRFTLPLGVGVAPTGDADEATSEVPCASAPRLMWMGPT